MDREYIILEEIDENQHISQRQLAQKTGLSLGSVNILLKKMVREGLVKVETVPANRVVYMITPKGMMEKANKTYRYIRHHYRMIEVTKQKIKEIIIQLLEENHVVYIVLNRDEISHIVRISIEELDIKERVLVFDENKGIDKDGVMLTVDNEDYEKYKKLYDRVVCLSRRL